MTILNEQTIYNILQSEKYPAHRLKISKWLTDKNEISNRIHKLVEIKRETEKAYLISFDIPVENEYWIPKSQCEIQQRQDASVYDFRSSKII